MTDLAVLVRVVVDAQPVRPAVGGAEQTALASDLAGQEQGGLLASRCGLAEAQRVGRLDRGALPQHAAVGTPVHHAGARADQVQLASVARHRIRYRVGGPLRRLVERLRDRSEPAADRREMQAAVAAQEQRPVVQVLGIEALRIDAVGEHACRLRQAAGRVPVTTPVMRDIAVAGIARKPQRGATVGGDGDAALALPTRLAGERAPALRTVQRIRGAYRPGGIADAACAHDHLRRAPGHLDAVAIGVTRRRGELQRRDIEIVMTEAVQIADRA